MAKCFSCLLSWFLIFLLVLLQTQTGNGRSNNATSKSGVIKWRVGVPKKNGFPQFVNVVSDSGEEKQHATGYCIDVFKAVVERLNLPYEASLDFEYDVIDSHSSTTYDSLLHKIPKEGTVRHGGRGYNNQGQPFKVRRFYNLEFSGQVVAMNCSRFVLMVWLLLAFVLMQSYTANLTSILTLDQLRPSFLNVDDLREGGYYVGYQTGSFVKDMLVKQLNFKPSKLRPYSNISDYHHALNNGSQGGGVAAIFDEVLFLKVFLQQFGSNYIMTGPTYKNNGFGFAFPLNSNLTSYFSRAILNVTESDLMNEIEEKYFGKNVIGEDQYVDKSPSLNFYSFSGLFLITGIATLLALLISETTVIWQRLILKAKAYSQRNLFPTPPSAETRVHPTHDSTHRIETI